MKETCDVDEESLRALFSATFGRFWHGVTSHSGLRAVHTWAPRFRQRDTHYARRFARDLFAWVIKDAANDRAIDGDGQGEPPSHHGVP